MVLVRWSVCGGGVGISTSYRALHDFREAVQVQLALQGGVLWGGGRGSVKHDQEEVRGFGSVCGLLGCPPPRSSLRLTLQCRKKRGM